MKILSAYPSPKFNFLNPFKALISLYLSLDLFIRISILTFILILASTPFIIANTQIFKPSAQVTTISSVNSGDWASTYESISVYTNFSGDSNADNNAVLEYRKVGDLTWKNGMALTVDRRDTVTNAGSTYTNTFKNQWRGSIVGLTAGTSYEIRVTYNDPDGVQGTNPIVSVVATRAETDQIPSVGRSLYVAPTGDDIRGLGTEASSWQTIQKAADNVLAGDTVYVKAGTYSENVVITRSGLSTNYITFRNFGTDTVTITPPGSTTDRTVSGFATNASYLRIKGFRIEGGHTGFRISGNSKNVIVEDNVIWGFAVDGYGIRLGGNLASPGYQDNVQVENITLQRNRIEVTVRQVKDHGGIESSGYNPGGHVIRYNTIQFFYDGDGTHGEDCIGHNPNGAYSDSFKDTDIYSNTCINSTDDAIELDGNNVNTRVWNNVMTDSNLAFSIAASAVGPTYVFRNVYHKPKFHWTDCVGIKQGRDGTGHVFFYHNVFMLTGATCNNSGLGMADSGGATQSQNVIIKNNIFRFGQREVSLEAGTTSSVVMNYNLLFDESEGREYAKWNNAVYSTFAAFRSATGQEQNGIYGQATFVDSANGDFHLVAGSLGIDSGEVIVGFNDANSAWAFSGSAPDMGAFERGGVGGPSPTVTPTVGPTSTPTPTLIPTPSASPSGTSFIFTAAGDFGAGGGDTTPTLNLIPSSGSNFSIALGDFSYGEITPESAWCSYVKGIVGATFPFQLISGNHEDDNDGRIDGYIDNFVSCLPNRIGTLTGTYGKEYYFDYNNLARFILVSPGLDYNPDGSPWSYSQGTTHYNWVVSAIDDARAQGIPWVIVGMHTNCQTVGEKGCSSSFQGIGTSFMDLLISKKVDLILQAHDHDYQRSKQLAIGPLCATVPANGVFDSDCVVDNGSDGAYTKDAGTVFVISGTGGASLDLINTADPEIGYFANWMGAGASQSHGLVKYTVSATEILAQFLPATGSFTDTFRIRDSGIGGGPTNTPTPTPLPVANCTLTSASWSKTTAIEGETVSLNVIGSSECNGQQIRFVVTENDSLFEAGIDDPARTNPINVTFSGTTAVGAWVTEWQNDCSGLCLPPEFYFNATLVSDSSKTIRSSDPMIEVSSVVVIPTPIPSPTPTPVVAPTVGPTATPTVTVVPTATLTPTPIPLACVFTSASWNASSATEGQRVNLNVIGSPECDGKQISFEITENDSLLEGGIDEPVTTNPANVTFLGSTATGSWTTEWQNDCAGFCLPPEFFFKATLVEDITKTIRSSDPMLEVNQAVSPTPTPIPTRAPTATAMPTPTPVVSTVTVQGRHVDINGNALSTNIGQRVTLNTGETNSELGAWDFSRIPSGRYTVTAQTVPGYITSYAVCINTDCASEANYTLGNFVNVNLPSGGNYADIYFKYTPIALPTPSSSLTISSVPQVTTTESSATVIWSTNRSSTSQVQYGVSGVYGKLTSLQDSGGVLSHSVNIAGLDECTVYYYQAISQDDFSNFARSVVSRFITSGCNGSVVESVESDDLVDRLLGDALNLYDSFSYGISLQTPPSYLDRDAFFQILKLNRQEFLNNVLSPSGFNPIGDYVYHLNSFENDVDTEISNFDRDITIKINYKASDIEGVDESTLTIRKWDGASWLSLPNCTVDTANKSVTCTTTSFSDFVLFGQPISTPTPTSAPAGYGTPSYGSPSYGSPSYGSPSYGSPSYGSPSYGTPSSGGGSSDLNKDGKTNIFDLSIMLRNWNKGGQGDLNSDGKVNIFDLSILLRSWGK